MPDGCDPHDSQKKSDIAQNSNHVKEVMALKRCIPENNLKSWDPMVRYPNMHEAIAKFIFDQ